ncbi:extracellular solute-binding protein [Paenibacillus piri]|uniref:Extracellular solute-binding protein n=1 Tax=Paenibacillus piri TaxID=2547395 RepID=A0A4R5KQR8_9BACL|nr:extracellular solute-binding protein [Paenibacillus piri]TDF98113.1 extracellular solute-binding protein [Paenibacillus piri]
MKPLRKTFISTAALSVLSSAALSGCSPSAGTDSGVPKQGDASQANIPISWVSFNPPDTDDTPVQKALEQKFNVTFKNIRLERGSYGEQLNIKLSGGDIPDVIWLDTPEQVASFAKQGVLAELPESEIRQALPGYAKSIDAIDSSLWKYSLVDGKNYVLPVYWPLGSLPFLPGYNGDWLKKIGYSEPPKTLEQFEDVLRKFRNDDPDGNGVKDTYGYSAYGSESRSFNTVFGAFQVNPSWMVQDNKIINGLVTDRAREALKVLNKWYKEGLIDPEFITKKPNDVHNDFINKKIGVEDWMSFQFNTQMGIIGVQFKAKNPNTPIVVGKPLTGPHGPGTAYSYGAKNGFVALGVQVAKLPEKKARILKLLDALSSDESTYLTAVYGLEGQHYQLQDGKPIMKPEYASEALKYKIGAGTFYGLFGNKSSGMEKFDYPSDVEKFRQQLGQGVKTIEQLKVSVPAQTKYPDLGKLESEYIVKFIKGDVDLDKGFDNFVALWKKSGGQETTDEINSKYAGIYTK